jgi:hypothetical protein
MPFAAGVASAGEVFASLFVDFQIVGDVLALPPSAKDQAIRRMVKTKEFHGVLQGGGHSLQPHPTHRRKRDLPHSKQRALSRDVINPQDGHILCDPAPDELQFQSLPARPTRNLFQECFARVRGVEEWSPRCNIAPTLLLFGSGLIHLAICCHFEGWFLMTPISSGLVG